MKNLKDSLDGLLSGDQPVAHPNIPEHRAVRQEMERQWRRTGKPDDAALAIKESAWNNISGRIMKWVPLRRFRAWQICGITACILLAASIGVISRKPEKIYTTSYIFHAGNQDRASVTMSDGTEVIVGARSKIIYPEQFEDDIRLVEVEGQVFFDVAHDKERKLMTR